MASSCKIAPGSSSLPLKTSAWCASKATMLAGIFPENACIMTQRERGFSEKLIRQKLPPDAFFGCKTCEPSYRPSRWPVFQHSRLLCLEMSHALRCDFSGLFPKLCIHSSSFQLEKYFIHNVLAILQVKSRETAPL